MGLSTKLKQPIHKILKSRPNYPRWLRRSSRGKNKRHSKKTLDRALQEGYFSVDEVNAIRENLGGNG